MISLSDLVSHGSVVSLQVILDVQCCVEVQLSVVVLQ